MCNEYFKAQKSKISFYTLLSLCTLILSLTTPYITGSFIDDLISNDKLLVIVRYCLLFLIISLANLAISFVQRLLYIKLQTRTGFQFNRELIEHVQKINISELKDKDLASLNQQINNDANSLITFYLDIFNNLFSNILTIPLLITVCFLKDRLITLLFVPIYILYIISYRFIKDKKYKFTYDLKQNQISFFSKLYEQLNFIELIKEQSIGNYFINRLNKPFEKLLKSVENNTKMVFIVTGIDTIIFIISQLALYILAAYQVYMKEMSVGDFIIFSTYYGVIISSIRYFFNFGSIYQEVLVSYKRTKELLNIEAETPGIANLKNIDEISIKNLTFHFHDNIGFSNLNVNLKKGGIYGIVGRNGAGKSTMLKILLTLYNNKMDRGAITFNNETDINDISKDHYKRHLIAYTEQEINLFSSSVETNIVLDNSVDNIDFINMLFKELDFEYDNDQNNLIDAGLLSRSDSEISNLSLGEKQKIGLLRALRKDADVILLDEPTASLDNKARIGLMRFLKKIKSNKIILIVTHDPYIIDHCDDLITLN